MRTGMQGIIDGAASVLSCAEGQGLNQSVIRSWRHLFRDAYEAEDREFIECIKGDKPPKVGGRDGMMAVSVVKAGNESIMTRKPVKVAIPG